MISYVILGIAFLYAVIQISLYAPKAAQAAYP